jgi:hypothetical protein
VFVALVHNSRLKRNSQMPIRPLVDPEGRLIIRGAVVGSQVFETEMAIILLLKLEQFESLLPVLDAPPEWEPLMRGEASPDQGAKAADGQEPPRSAPIVQMLQIAVPPHEARKLGWALTETANQILKPSSPQPKH